MRAAFVAVQSGKQVAVLVPTTLLAQQHFDTLRDRFADWPVQIESMSRLRSESEVNEVVRRMASGQADIVIGTHKLLSHAGSFSDLGLVIIDEEHRFGVRQKERLKALRAEVDVLTLTATPIPRTLNMAMSGLRELSIIATPPARRLSIKTFVMEKRRHVIQEAVSRELMRGGQVFYLHNEVKTIAGVADELAAQIPEARIGVGHGQMPKRELEQVMNDFYHRQLNVLVCTTIIENGIDVPNANTIVIERADRFGLAQLHQLRGRVGRSHRQAYAYLLTPHPKAMTADAVKRLEAIEAAGELGVGFTLATQDMEIRGAGELLGDEQSGQIESVGFSLYTELLERAVQSIREGRTPDPDAPLEPVSQEVNLHVGARIPEDYLPDVHARLILYKRIANARQETDLDDLQGEVIDRFGMLPEPMKQLFRITALKLKMQPLGIKRLDLGSAGGKLEFNQDTPVDPGLIVSLVQTESATFRLEGATGLRITRNLPEFDARLEFATQLLDRLAATSGSRRALSA
ncbi:MAG: TRCF domain-containing protein [Gammaproteobacteria bacterium]|nr:TRCF domain-containing protein [Gammaproteobacteria bacterium]